MTINLRELQEMVEQGYVRKVVHPLGHLELFNYSEKCTYEGIWNETTRQCRGLILDLEGNIVARGLQRVGLEIVFASGRDSVCRPETEEWLDRHGYGSHALYMRPEGDMRKDSIVKRELLDEIAKVWKVIGVLDDRDQVVSMWREIGLPCFQVAPGNF